MNGNQETLIFYREGEENVSRLAASCCGVFLFAEFILRQLRKGARRIVSPSKVKQYNALFKDFLLNNYVFMQRPKAQKIGQKVLVCGVLITQNVFCVCLCMCVWGPFFSPGREQTPKKLLPASRHCT